MEIGVQRADRLHPNGPRVSFNRDVHVKRIATRPNEKDYPIQTTNLLPPQSPNLRRELPTDLSEESILKEAARVLAQAERIRCTTDSPSDKQVGGGSGKSTEKSRSRGHKREAANPNYFNSLPTRKKASSKPISRSVSDAASKKPKKPSIFNIFSRKSDTNLDQIGQDQRAKESSAKRLTRSKSDVEPSRERKRASRKRNNSENDDSLNVVKPAQLSPIIENSLKEDYFSEIGDPPQSEPKDKPTQPKSNEDKVKVEKDSKEKAEKDSKERTENGSKESSKTPELGGSRRNSQELVTSTPISENIKDVISSLASHSKSQEDMHSSQLPPEKPPLTKGVTVDGMVKRLSMERFSPPPHISGPAFSYTRPNDQVIYAQVICDSDLKDKHYTVNNNNKDEGNKNMEYRYETNDFKNHRHVVDETRPYQSNGVKRSDYPSHKTGVYINGDSRYRSYSPQPMAKPRASRSPNNFKRSPRNLSDEDEGLGFEPRKYFEEEIQANSLKIRDNRFSANYERRSPTEEPPIVPIIRSLSPVEIRLETSPRGQVNGTEVRRKEVFVEQSRDFNTLSHRREILESKIRSRRIGSVEPTEIKRTEYLVSRQSPERRREYAYNHSPEPAPREYIESSPRRFASPKRDTSPKYHKVNSYEILKKYSPERTHLDMVSPSRDVKTSKFTKTRCYDDGTGGVKEVYKRETYVDEYGQPHVRESRHRERVDSPRRSSREADYSQDQIEEKYRHEYEPKAHDEEKYRHEYEPKSLDSQFSELNRSSPENIKRSGGSGRKYDEQWQDSLKRDKRNQRSFDKGDSGIENDFRKESFNGEFSSKWRKRTYTDDIKSSDIFIRKERRHTEETHPSRRQYDFVFRERSIDDGSHYDPRLDKYPKDSLRKSREHNDSGKSASRDLNGTLKREKKKGGLEKMKQLFSGSGRKKEPKESKDPKEKDPKDSKESKNLKEFKESKEVNGKVDPKIDYMVREAEMRSRYHEYKGVVVDLREPKIPDIATRRRLSTPKASPLPKRTPAERELRPSPLASKDEPTFVKAEKSGWFKSLDRLSRKKSMKGEKPSLSSVPIDDDFSKTSKSYQSPTQMQPKSLRFFGDTDMESNPSMSKGASQQKARPTVMTIGRNHKYSQSVNHLDRLQKSNEKQNNRSSSLQNLDDDGVDEVDRPKKSHRHHSRSRNLDDISESGSDTDPRRKDVRQTSVQRVSPKENRENESHSAYHNRKYYDEEIHHRSQERDSRSPLREHNDTARIEFRKPPPGPPKPARSMERRTTYSRERERLHDSSGTEGDSSLQSQRSVVYLHATTVGAIPQPYHLTGRRRAMSREELSSIKSKDKQPIQPMTRTVSRSVSMLAPWKPKHLHEGYEINYSQEGIEQHNGKHATMPRKPASGSSNKSKRSSSSTNTHTRTRKSTSKDDLSSIRNSSTTSASKSGLSSAKKSSESSRKDTIGRRKVK